MNQRAGSSSNDRYAFDIPLSEVRSPVITKFEAYWQSKRKGDFLPGRADIAPWEIVDILPDIVLLDVMPQSLRCRIRLVGTRAAERRGDHTGQYLDEVSRLRPDRRRDYLAEMRLVCEQARPAYARDWLRLRHGGEKDIYAGIWPLAADGRNVNMLVVIEDWAQLRPDDVR